MSVSADPFEVLSSERGVVRVFVADESVVLVPDAVHAFLGQNIELDASRVEVFDVSVLGEMTLVAYLADGYGIPAQDLAGAEDALNSAEGLIVLVASSAFQGRALTLEPNAALTFLGAFQEPGSAPPKSMVAPDAAEGVLAGGDQNPVPVSPRRPVIWLVALLALLVAAGLVLFATF